MDLGSIVGIISRRNDILNTDTGQSRFTCKANCFSAGVRIITPAVFKVALNRQVRGRDQVLCVGQGLISCDAKPIGATLGEGMGGRGGGYGFGAQGFEHFGRSDVPSVRQNERVAWLVHVTK